MYVNISIIPLPTTGLIDQFHVLQHDQCVALVITICDLMVQNFVVWELRTTNWDKAVKNLEPDS